MREVRGVAGSQTAFLVEWYWVYSCTGWTFHGCAHSPKDRILSARPERYGGKPRRIACCSGCYARAIWSECVYEQENKGAESMRAEQMDPVSREAEYERQWRAAMEEAERDYE